MMFKKQTAWTRHTIFYLLKTEKKAKAISHCCSNSIHTAEEWPCEARAGALSRCDKHGTEGRVPTGSPSTPGRATPSRQGGDSDPPLVYSKAPWPETSAKGSYSGIALTRGVHMSFILWQTNLPQNKPRINLFLHLRLCMFGFQGWSS